YTSFALRQAGRRPRRPFGRRGVVKGGNGRTGNTTHTWARRAHARAFSDTLATVAAGRTALVERFRTIAAQLEALPLDTAAEVLVLLERPSPNSSGRRRWRSSARPRAPVDAPLPPHHARKRARNSHQLLSGRRGLARRTPRRWHALRGVWLADPPLDEADGASTREPWSSPSSCPLARSRSTN